MASVVASLPKSHGSNSAPVPVAGTSPGYTTTEFWVTVVSITGCFALVALDRATLDQVWPIMASLGGGYSLSRGMAKAGLAKIVGRG